MRYLRKIPVSEINENTKKYRKELTNGRSIVGNHRINICDSDIIMLGKVVLCEPLSSQFDIITFSTVGSKRGKCFWSFLGPIPVDMVPSFGAFCALSVLLLVGHRRGIVRKMFLPAWQMYSRFNANETGWDSSTRHFMRLCSIARSYLSLNWSREKNLSYKWIRLDQLIFFKKGTHDKCDGRGDNASDPRDHYQKIWTTTMNACNL